MLITLDDAVTHLTKGDIVALPSETVYGLAGLALNVEAVQKIFTIKERPATNPLIVHTSSLEKAENLCEINNLAKKAAETFWPGPLSLVLPKKDVVPDIVTAGNNTVAIRIPKHPVFLEILKKLGKPLAAPSANPSNRTSPTKAKHIKELFGKASPPTVDGGQAEVGLESTVLDLSGSKPTILRPGMITRAELANCLGIDVELLSTTKSSKPCMQEKELSAPSPGMHQVHYAPKTPMKLYNSLGEFRDAQNFGAGDAIIVSEEKIALELRGIGFPECTCLSVDGCPYTIAQNLYATLIELDAHKTDRMHLIFSGENKGVSRAILDRLQRAAKA